MDVADLIRCPACNGQGHTWEVDGRVLRQHRLALGIPGADMARRLEIPPQELHDKETHRQNRRFTEDQARQFLAALNGG